MLSCTRPSLLTSQQDGRRVQESSLLPEELLTVDGCQGRDSQFLIPSMSPVIDYAPVNDPVFMHLWTTLIGLMRYKKRKRKRIWSLGELEERVVGEYD